MFQMERKNYFDHLVIEVYFQFRSLNLDEVLELEKKLLSMDVKDSTFVFLHLKVVEYLDASALGMLFRYQKYLQDKGVHVALIKVNPTIKMLLGLTKAKKMFFIFETTEEALENTSSFLT